MRGGAEKIDLRCDTRMMKLRYKKEVRSSYMKHDGPFSTVCILLLLQQSKKSIIIVDQERERVVESRLCVREREREWGTRKDFDPC